MFHRCARKFRLCACNSAISSDLKSRCTQTRCCRLAAGMPLSSSSIPTGIPVDAHATPDDSAIAASSSQQTHGTAPLLPNRPFKLQATPQTQTEACADKQTVLKHQQAQSGLEISGQEQSIRHAARATGHSTRQAPKKQPAARTRKHISKIACQCLHCQHGTGDECFNIRAAREALKQVHAGKA